MKSEAARAYTGIKLAAAGLLAGFVNGLLGAGGGIIIVFAISKLLSDVLPHKNDIFANALCVMLPVSLLSCFIYGIKGNLSTEGFGIFVIPAVLGGIVGGLLLGKIGAAFLKRLFALLVIVSGIILIVR